MQRAASAGRLLHKAAGKPPQSPPERGGLAAPPSQRRILLQPVQARLMLAAVLVFLVWLATSAGMLRTSLLQSHPRGSGPSAANCPAHVARQLEWVGGVEAEQAALQEGIRRLEAQIEALKTSTAAPALPSTLPGGGSGGRLASDAGGGRQDAAPFLLVAVLSVAGNRERRDAIRATWKASAPPEVAVRFFLYTEEAGDAVAREGEEEGDIVLVPSGGATDYRSIVFKVFAMVEWVVQNTNPNFVLKTDDDAYVDCNALARELRHRCRSPDCRNERLYLGEEKRNGEVITVSGNKWSNVEYWEHTGLREYMPYMFGGGYVFSSDIARALHLANKIAALKSMPNEDATFGFWLSGMNLARMDHPHFKTAAGECCLWQPGAEDVDARWAAHALRFLEPLCARGPGLRAEGSADWLVLHKVTSLAIMQYLHARLAGCGEERALLARAEALAAAAGRPAPVVHPMQLHMLTDLKTGYHFTGDTAGSPWSPDGRLVLALRTTEQPHALVPGSKVAVGVLHFAEGFGYTLDHPGWEWRELDASQAWNYHSGPHAQWVGASGQRLLFNDRGCGAGAADLCAVLYDVAAQKRVGTLPRPVMSLSPDGASGLSVDFERLEASTPGRGYVGAAPRRWPDAAWACPARDGLWAVDVASGRSRLLVSYRALHEALLPNGSFGAGADAETGLLFGAGLPKLAAGEEEEGGGGGGAPDPSRACIYSIDQAHFSQDGAEVAFRLRVTNCTGERAPTRMPWHSASSAPLQHAFFFTIRPDGSRLWRVPAVPSDFDGRLDFGPAGRLLLCQGKAAFLIENRRGVTLLAKPRPLLASALGSCRFAPGGARHVLGETRGSSKEAHRVFVWDLERRDAFIAGRFWDSDWRGEPYARASLQPRWSRDARHIAFQSSTVWGTGIQAFVVGVQTLQVPGPRAAAAAPQQAAAQQAAAGPRPGARSEERRPTEVEADPVATGPSSSSGGSSDDSKSVRPLSSLMDTAADARSGSDNEAGDASRSQGRRRLTGRRLLVDLSGPRLSGLRHLLGEASRAGGSQPDAAGLAGWELHLFGMGPGPEEAGGAAAAGPLAQAEALGATVVKHVEEADAEEVGFGSGGGGGRTANGTARSSALGAADSDQTDVQAIVRIMQGRMSPTAVALPRKHGTLARLRCWLAGSCADAAWVEYGAAQPQPEEGGGGGAAEPAPSVDLSQWLLEAVRPQEGDHLTLALDVDSILQNNLIRRLVADESIALVGRLLVRWHFRASDWHMMSVAEEALAVLGVPWDYITDDAEGAG